MVQIARQFGVSAKITESGCVIIGTYQKNTFDDMHLELKQYVIEVIKPEIVKLYHNYYSNNPDKHNIGMQSNVRE